MGLVWIPALLAGTALVGLVWNARTLRRRREDCVRRHLFDKALLDKLGETYPALGLDERVLVSRALRDFFLIHIRAGKRLIVMPSRAVDVLWHEFILDTKPYHRFCKRAFGGYFHHVPPARMQGADWSRKALRRTWDLACALEKLNPNQAARLPLLFGLDERLGIPEGRCWNLQDFRREDSSSDGCGGDGGDGDSGCGGDGGCGGGCGGGD
ncbi:hypothetical protein [Zoogloea sp.]|uniref:glycine-rich domain-containing protein n=1 Tax=Zoogloea sp. TaxID=49181 RepID=UPI0035B322DA|nr:hypothetical protein [Rhodocyclales bacterium]